MLLSLFYSLSLAFLSGQHNTDATFMLVTPGSLPTVPALLMTVLAMGECVAGCPDGWFGSACEYKCHCMEQCDIEDEGCYHCQNGYFGPECQYVDAVYWLGSPTNPPYLTNKSITSCNPSRFARFVRLTFTASLRFSWFRLQVNDESVLHKFNVKLNGIDNTCVKERRYNITQTTVDVFCDTTLHLKVLTIEGTVAPNICSIYVSAVDSYMERGFTVSTYSPSGLLIEKHYSPLPKDARNTPYDFITQSHLPVQTVKVKGSFGEPLSMCEVIVYGDYVCPDLRHGLGCKYKCLCKGHETCNVVSGKCSAGCPPGFYGFQCSKGCNTTCIHEPCLQVSGQCYRCPAGYKGELCDEDCYAGTYGRSCENRCSENCANECDPIDGFCECTHGYRQPGCTECQNGTYGSLCSQNCSVNCLGRKCDHVSGKCLKCVGSRKGYFCEDCPTGMYGVDCTKNCSTFCLFRKCDPNNGNCFKCLPGRIGAHCTECPEHYYGYACNATCPENCESGLCHVDTGLCGSCASNYIGPTCSRAVGYTSKLKYFSPLLILCLIPCIFLLLRKKAEDSENDHSTACGQEWFGDRCRFHCRCNQTGCSQLGECTRNNLCASSYFGPRCQYLNVASLATGNPGFLNDNDETSCNPDHQTTSIFFDLKLDIRFFWLRLYLRMHENATDVEVRLNDQVDSCPNQKVMYNIPRTRDVMCDTKLLVRNLTIRGALVPSICSLEVGSGINAALLQSANQSSTDSGKSADLAVDGDGSTCIKTQQEPGGPEWTVTFFYPYVLYRVMIYDTPTHPKGLAECTLITYGENMVLVEKYDSPSDYNRTSLDVNLFSHLPVKSLMIKAGDASGRLLTLCEVQAYGVQVCPEGFYGFACLDVCTCNPYENCDAITGACTQGCRDGFYGFQCNSSCPTNCRTARCNTRTGTCRRCADGYTGDTCRKSCPSGRHGLNCTKTCPTICEADLCDPVNGDCYKCKGKFEPPNCDECSKGVFGLNCSSPCAEHCKDGLCNNITGFCEGCKPRFEGDNCEAEVYQPPWLYIIAGIICFLLFLLCIILLLRKPRKKPQAEEEHKRPATEPVSENVTEVEQSENAYNTETEVTETSTALT